MIVGFNVDSIDAERNLADAKGQIQINYNPIIEDIEKTSVSALDEKVARINYNFQVNYNVGDTTTARIELKGNILWKGKTDEIVEEWNENEQLLEDIQAPLMNDLYRKSLSQAVGIADTLNLLPPIPTPRVDQN